MKPTWSSARPRLMHAYVEDYRRDSYFLFRSASGAPGVGGLVCCQYLGIPHCHVTWDGLRRCVACVVTVPLRAVRTREASRL